MMMMMVMMVPLQCIRTVNRTPSTLVTTCLHWAVHQSESNLWFCSNIFSPLHFTLLLLFLFFFCFIFSSILVTRPFASSDTGQFHLFFFLQHFYLYLLQSVTFRFLFIFRKYSELWKSHTRWEGNELKPRPFQSVKSQEIFDDIQVKKCVRFNQTCPETEYDGQQWSRADSLWKKNPVNRFSRC